MGRLLVFGGGLIGGHVAGAAIEEGWQVSVAATTERPGLPGAEWRSVDITDPGAVDRAIDGLRPDAVVNAAAVSAIDRAEREQDATWRVNVEGARHVAVSCAGRRMPLVFFSSDAVLDGEDGPYDEAAVPRPVNFYGRTKAAAEAEVLAADPVATILRISLVLGYPLTGGNCYSAALEARLAAGQEVPSSTEEIRTPIDVGTLARCVLELTVGRVTGILNLGATAWASRYELARRAAAAMGYARELVTPESGPPAAGRAPRHRHGTLVVARAQHLLRTPLPTLDEAIARAVAGHGRGAGGGKP